MSNKLTKLEKSILNYLNPVKIDGNIINYMVSIDGKIFNKDSKELSQFTCSSGKYKAVHIKINGGDYKRMVHRIVAESFIPNPENKPQVNHKDANTFNNNVNNLEWVTAKENIHHTIKLGNQIVGTSHKNSKFSDEQIHEACKMLENDKFTFANISRCTGVGIKTIKNIRSGSGWPHIAKFYNIINKKRHRGPIYSIESKQIIELIKAGKSNNEIRMELGLSGSVPKEKIKSINDKIYHIRKKIS